MRGVAYVRPFRIDGDAVKMGGVLTIQHETTSSECFSKKESVRFVKNKIPSVLYIEAQSDAGFYEREGFIL